MQTRINDAGRRMARALGWFSLALGMAELVASRKIKQGVGLVGPEAVLQAYGVREIGTGLAILGSERPVGMVWGRVIGDLLDLATAAPVLRPGNPRRAAGAASFTGAAAGARADFFGAGAGDFVLGMGRRRATGHDKQGEQGLHATGEAGDRGSSKSAGFARTAAVRAKQGRNRAS